jgi:hypothetical protein
MAGRGQDHLGGEERVRLQGVLFEPRPPLPQPVVGAGLTQWDQADAKDVRTPPSVPTHLC